MEVAIVLRYTNYTAYFVTN